MPLRGIRELSMKVNDKLSASDLEKMSKPELEKKLEELKNAFSEVDEERLLILGQENLHLHAAVAKNYEEELSTIKENIELIEGFLDR